MIISKRWACAVGMVALSTGFAAAAPARVETDLNVRSGEGTGYPVIAVMPAGAVVDVRGCADGWCFVSDYNGFASAAYLDVGGRTVAPLPPAYVAPRVSVIPGPVYREPRYWNDRRFIRRGIRGLQRELRRDRRWDARQERRQERREARQERREQRQEPRRDRRD